MRLHITRWLIGLGLGSTIAIAVPQLSQQEKAMYFNVESISAKDGAVLDQVLINGPSVPPLDIPRPVVMPLKDSTSSNAIEGVQTSGSTVSPNSIILETPAFSWSFGCAATAGAMIAGYYDRNGYPYVYAGPTNHGIMPIDNSSWPDWTDSNGDTRHQTPLSATHDGLDGRSGRGHVDDYWVKYNSTDDDPFVTDGVSEHTYGECTGDYMKTNQTTNYGNSDGATTFYFYNSGNPLTAQDMENNNIDDKDGGYGLKLFFESRGYTVPTLYNQKIDAVESGGFTFDQYKSEIDAGRPVLIHLEGHTVTGVGYDDENSTIYLHDTWDYDTHSMTWGGSYSGMDQFGVTVIALAKNVVKGDFNKDGIPDMVWKDSDTNKIRLWLMRQDATFESAYVGRFSTDYDMMGIEKFDGDDIADIIWIDASTNKIYVWYMNQNSTYSSHYMGRISTDYNASRAGDFNGDGIQDILFYDRNEHKAAVWYMLPNRTKRSQYIGRISSSYHPANVGDLNGDQKDDIVWVDQNTNKVHVWYMHEDGTYTDKYIGRFNTAYTLTDVIDLDGDGNADIGWKDDATNKIYFWKMAADGTYTQLYIGKFNTDYEVEALRDFNSDGILDFMWRDPSSNKVYVWYMHTDGSHTTVYIGRMGSSYETEFIGDLNGDGIADIMWRDSGENKVGVWYMQANGTYASKYVGRMGLSYDSLEYVELN